MKKPNMIIRMGAAHWDALVRAGERMVHFNMRAMDQSALKRFTFETVKAFRLVGEQARSPSGCAFRGVS